MSTFSMGFLFIFFFCLWIACEHWKFYTSWQVWCKDLFAFCIFLFFLLFFVEWRWRKNRNTVCHIKCVAIAEAIKSMQLLACSPFFFLCDNFYDRLDLSSRSSFHTTHSHMKKQNMASVHKRYLGCPKRHRKFAAAAAFWFFFFIENLNACKF